MSGNYTLAMRRAGKYWFSLKLDESYSGNIAGSPKLSVIAAQREMKEAFATWRVVAQKAGLSVRKADE